jgi:hypothetical protein
MHAYIRFPAVAVPQGATITSASLVLTCGESSSGVTANFNIYANDIDDSVAPTTVEQFNTIMAAVTSAAVEWSSVPAKDAGQAFAAQDVTALIQEIVDGAGWASENAIGIMIKNNGSSNNAIRKFYSRDGETSSYWPKLTITYDTSIQASMDEDFTVHAAMDAWKSPDELAEGFTVNASMKAGFQYEGSISEDLTVNAAMSVEKEIRAPISENLTVNAAFDAIATYNRGLAASASVADSIDALATYNRGLASAVSLGAVMDAEFKWPVKRQVFPYRAQGKRLSIKIGCAEKGSWIKLLDISTTVIPMVGRTRSQAVKLKGIGNHIGVKIGNTDGATLKLAYVGLQIERPIGR